MIKLKTVVITLAAMGAFQGQARFRYGLKILSVDRVLAKTESADKLTLKKDTFIWNIQGYACQVPAIQVPRQVFYESKLKQAEPYEYGVRPGNEAFVIKQKGMGFCSANVEQSIFGPEFVTGQTKEIQVTTERALVTYEDNEGKARKALREIVSTNLLGVELESTAYVLLDLESEAR